MQAVATAVPERSLVQRMEALKRANDVRSYRAVLKRDLKRRIKSAGEVLECPEQQVETMKVFDLLIATPKHGRVKVLKILSQAKVSPSKTIGGLSPRQRSEILTLMRSRR